MSKPVPGKLYWLVQSFSLLCNERLCELELTPEGVICSTTLVTNHIGVPVMFLARQIVHHPSNPFAKVANTTSTVAKCLVGERVAFFANRKEVTRRDVFYKVPVFEEWDMKAGKEK